MVKEFIKSVFDGTYDFWGFIKELGDLFNKLGETVIYKDLTVAAIFTSPGLYSYILAAVGLVFLLYGRKFLPLIKFLAFGAVGYVVGTVYAYPALMVAMPGSALVTPVTCGVTAAVIGAVLCKLLYGVLYLGAGVMFTYVICFGGGLIPGLPTVGNATLSYVAVAIVVLLLLLLRKNISRLGLSMAGAYFVVEAFTKNFLNMSSPWNYIAMGLIALMGFAYQHNRRKKYL